MKPLALSGRATRIAINGKAPDRLVLRLANPTLDRLRRPTEHDAALITTSEDASLAASAGFQTAVFLVPRQGLDAAFVNCIELGEEFSHLSTGDILGVQASSGRLRVLYRQQSRHNWFLVTERCNHYCLMCSQPPKDVDDWWIMDEIAAAIRLIDPAPASLGFTGGEPFLNGQQFIDLIGAVRDCLPETSVHVLTNGRAFGDPAVTAQWAALKHPKLSVGIPIYSAVDHIHDHVVQARGAFDETVLGIMRLKDRGQRVEIRVVLHALTAPRLEETCTWIARNLPFVDHVALMGLENTGFAIANDDLLWIDPVDYQDALASGIRALDAAGVHVSVFNLPLCLLDENVRPYAVQSISDWKNAYPEECSGCSAKSECAGFFSTGRPRLSRGIKPFTETSLALA